MTLEQKICSSQRLLKKMVVIVLHGYLDFRCEISRRRWWFLSLFGKSKPAKHAESFEVAKAGDATAPLQSRQTCFFSLAAGFHRSPFDNEM